MTSSVKSARWPNRYTGGTVGAVALDRARAWRRGARRWQHCARRARGPRQGPSVWHTGSRRAPSSSPARSPPPGRTNHRPDLRPPTRSTVTRLLPRVRSGGKRFATQVVAERSTRRRGHRSRKFAAAAFLGRRGRNRRYRARGRLGGFKTPGFIEVLRVSTTELGLS